jgi:hypothetical protein
MGIEKRAESSRGNTRSSNREEHVMMFAFALAVIGIGVLKTLEHLTAHA